MRRDGLHFLIPDPAGPIDVADLRRNPNLPTSLVLDARDHAVQSWSTDYDGFCGPAGPVGTAVGDVGPFVLRLAGVPTAERLWEMPLLALHWALAADVRPVGRETARTVVWILGALDHRTGTPLADLAPAPATADPKALVEASLPRLRDDAAAGRTVVGLVARGDGAEAAVALLAEALPETRHRFAVFDRFSDVTEVLDEPTLPIPAPNVMPVPRSLPAAEPPPPAPAARHPVRAVAAAVALAVVATAGLWALERRAPQETPLSPPAETATPATAAATADPAAVSPAPPEAPPPPTANTEAPAIVATSEPAPPSPARVETPSPGDAAPAALANTPAPLPTSGGPSETGAVAGAQARPPTAEPASPTTEPAGSTRPDRPSPTNPPAPLASVSAPSPVVPPPRPVPATATGGPGATRPADPRPDVATTAPRETETASRAPIPSPAPRPASLPASRPIASAPTPAPTPPPTTATDLRIWQLVAGPGASCLQVFLGEAQPKRVELRISSDDHVAAVHRSPDLCGFDVSAGPGRRVAYDPAFLAAAHERAAPPDTRRFLLVAGPRSRGLPPRWRLEVSGGGRADRTYEQGLAE